MQLYAAIEEKGGERGWSGARRNKMAPPRLGDGDQQNGMRSRPGCHERELELPRRRLPTLRIVSDILCFSERQRDRVLSLRYDP